MDLHGERVYLRLVRPDDLELLSSWTNDIAHLTEFNFFGLTPPDALAKSYQEHGLISPESGMLLVVTRDGDHVIGDVSYHRVFYGPGVPSVAYNFGIVLTPDQRGQGYGVEAQRLLAAYLFSVYPVMRVEASTDITNLAEQRALAKAGFTREGVARKAQWRGGAYHDLVIYSKLRGE